MLTLNSTIPAFGLHQYVMSNAAKDRVYATTMSEPPRLFSWSVNESYHFTHLETTNISIKLYYIPVGAQWLDVYEIRQTDHKHVQRTSAIPADLRNKYTFRSNTVQPSRHGKYLFTSTRSWNNTEANGQVAAFELDCRAHLKREEAVTFYEAALTLGSAGGLRVAPWENETNCDKRS
ncbi:hypothetical protein BDV12DRAFT_199607 [Aspergillus spectabilis]